MIIPAGFCVIYQPKYRTPSVFDLHDRGMFKSRPPLTRDWGYRILADEELTLTLQFVQLVEKSAVEPQTGAPYAWRAVTALIDLDQDLMVASEAFSTFVPDDEIRGDIVAAHEEWRQAYVPIKDDGRIDRDALAKKLTSSIAERKAMIRKELAQRNLEWINAAMPRLVQNFYRGLHARVADALYPKYRQEGGEDNEDGLIKKMMLFNRVYETVPSDDLLRPDGGKWKREDDIWDCWVGFTGSETEARRVCRTMEAVFHPLIKEMAGESDA
ncbi:MAG: hypothetical protein V2B19_15495 [Pseudomonadota bacterium]